LNEIPIPTGHICGSPLELRKTASLDEFQTHPFESSKAKGPPHGDPKTQTPKRDDF